MNTHPLCRAWPLVAGIVFMSLALTGCGKLRRDPNKVRTAPPKADVQMVQGAKHQILADELETAAGTSTDMTPVSALFVNGDSISVDDALRWVRFDLGEQARKLPVEEYRVKLIDTLKKEVRGQVENCLLLQQAKHALGEVDNEKVDIAVNARMRELVNTQHGGRQSRYEEWLRERNITLAQDRERIRRELMITAYLQKAVTGRVAEPTRTELLQFRDEYVRDQQAHQKRYMLLIEVPIGARDDSGRTLSAPVPRDYARQKCQRALEKIRGGADFGEVAKEYSEGLNAESGGDWGWVTREGIRPHWKPAVDTLYALSKGQVSDVVETPEACFVVKCADADAIDAPDFATMQPKLMEAYKNRQFNVLTQELVGKLYEKAEIRPANPGRFLRAVVEAAPRPTGMQ